MIWNTKRYHNDGDNGVAEHVHDENCGCEDVELEFDQDAVLEISDPETGETYEFFLADEFDFNDQSYCVLVTTDEENPEYVIARIVPDGEDNWAIETLTEEEEEGVYDEYDRLLEEWMEEEGDEA